MNDRQFQIGLIAWLGAMAAILDAFFNILNPDANPVWFVYGFGLLFGLSAAGAMDIKFNIKWESNQMRVLTIGFMGGAGLMILQIAGQIFDATFSAYSDAAQLRVLAAVSEEFLFSIAVFGTLYMICRYYGLHWIFAAIPTALIFALFHFFAYGLALYALIILFVGGLILRWTYVEARDVGAPIIAHLINNGFLTMLAIGAGQLTTMWFFPVIVVLLFLAVTPFILLRGRKQ